MNVPVWCADLAAEFWARAGTVPPFPRDFRLVVAGALPLSVVELPGITFAAVRQWFERIALPIPLDEPNRRLRACLVAWLGEGFVFVDSCDEPAQQRFSLAHELAHFLRDYWQPRQAVARRLGRNTLEVLDGRRHPTTDERLHALLRNTSIGPFTHLLRRDECGHPLSPGERDAEVAADRLAFELLAPASAVGDAGGSAELIARLVGVFGLPPEPASRYAAILLPACPENTPIVTRFLIC